jgi:hypothetical protein
MRMFFRHATTVEQQPMREPTAGRERPDRPARADRPDRAARAERPNRLTREQRLARRAPRGGSTAGVGDTWEEVVGGPWGEELLDAT